MSIRCPRPPVIFPLHLQDLPDGLPSFYTLVFGILNKDRGGERMLCHQQNRGQRREETHVQGVRDQAPYARA